MTETATAIRRYSFQDAEGRKPVRNGKLAWVGDETRAREEGKSWGATHLITLEQNPQGTWDIVDTQPI